MGWTVVPKAHRGQEPPQHDKYLLWMNILKGKDERFPKVIFNGKNCNSYFHEQYKGYGTGREV